jgi:predicted Na+-dependent transporter
MLIFSAIWVEIIRNLVMRIKKYKDNTAKGFLLCTLILMFSGLTQETFWFNPSYGRFWMQYIFFYLMIFNFRADAQERPIVPL